MTSETNIGSVSVTATATPALPTEVAGIHGYTFQYEQKNPDKQFSHGWGFTPPVMATFEEYTNEQLVALGNSFLSAEHREDFYCYGAVATQNLCVDLNSIAMKMKAGMSNYGKNS